MIEHILTLDLPISSELLCMFISVLRNGLIVGGRRG